MFDISILTSAQMADIEVPTKLLLCQTHVAGTQAPKTRIV